MTKSNTSNDKENLKKKKESQLITAIKEDKKLDNETRLEYLSMANIFLKDLKANLNKTSLEMEEDTALGVDIWRDFLNYPVVRKYIQSFKDEQITGIADAGLMKGDKDAVNIKKVMQDRGPVVNNSNIVLIRLPEKKVFE